MEPPLEWARARARACTDTHAQLALSTPPLGPSRRYDQGTRIFDGSVENGALGKDPKQPSSWSSLELLLSRGASIGSGASKDLDPALAELLATMVRQASALAPSKELEALVAGLRKEYASVADAAPATFAALKEGQAWSKRGLGVLAAPRRAMHGPLRQSRKAWGRPPPPHSVRRDKRPTTTASDPTTESPVALSRQRPPTSPTCCRA